MSTATCTEKTPQISRGKAIERVKKSLQIIAKPMEGLTDISGYKEQVKELISEHQLTSQEIGADMTALDYLGIAIQLPA